MSDDTIDAELKGKVVQYFVHLANQTAVDLAERRWWKLEHGLSYRDSDPAGGTHLTISVGSEGEFYVFLGFPTEKFRQTHKWEDRCSITTVFSSGELAPLFEAIEASGLLSYLEGQKLIRESHRLLELEGCLETDARGGQTADAI